MPASLEDHPHSGFANPLQLLVVSGYPCAGKTHRSEQLFDFFTAKIASSTEAGPAKLKVHHVTTETLGLSRAAYHAARSEKDARATEMSAVKRLLNRDTIVIADGLNYIKGFRYQLNCEAKAVQTPSCVVHVGTSPARCREVNARRLTDADKTEAYSEEDFENLLFRYEEPNGMARWDSPLFTVVIDDATPPFDLIWEVLVGSDGQPKTVRPNAATVLKPAMEQNYLYELDKQTSDIVNQIISWQKDHPGEDGGEATVASVEEHVQLPVTPLSLPQLQRIRRQFIALNRQHNLDKGRISLLFVDYLNDTFRE